MLRKDLIICRTRTLLSEFIGPMMDVLDKPRQKFLRQAITAILFAGSLVITDLTRWIHDDCCDLFYRLKRLLNYLVSAAGDLAEVGVENLARRTVAKYRKILNIPAARFRKKILILIIINNHLLQPVLETDLTVFFSRPGFPAGYLTLLDSKRYNII